MTIQRLERLINNIREIDSFEGWFKKQTAEDIYHIFNIFIYDYKSIINDMNKIKEENLKIKKDSESLRKYLSKISIKEQEIDTICNNTIYCKRCNEKINLTIYGNNSNICWGCLTQNEKNDIINHNLGRG